MRRSRVRFPPGPLFFYVMRRYTLDGSKMTSPDSLYDELERVFKFPHHFGRNLDALADSLADLASQEPCKVIWKDAQKVQSSLPLFPAIVNVFEETPDLILRFENEPLSSLTHFIATLLSITGLSLLIVFAALKGTAIHIVTLTIFGAGLLLLYLTSTIYHFLARNHPTKKLFQLLDHSMIYVLIASTYTPLVLTLLPPGWGWSLFGIIWGLALVGIFHKALLFNWPHWISVMLYLVMGWLILIAYQPLRTTVSLAGFWWLFGGGLCYTLGTVFFALDHRITWKRWYTLHDVFHIFVMFGSLCHFWFMWRYIIPSP